MLLIAFFLGFSITEKVSVATEGVVNEIRARRFVVIREDGWEAVSISTTNDLGGGLTLYDSAGNMMGNFDVYPGGGRLITVNGKVRQALGALAAGNEGGT